VGGEVGDESEGRVRGGMGTVGRQEGGKEGGGKEGV